MYTTLSSDSRGKSRGGRAPNQTVRDNFARVPDPGKKIDIGICKHCHWRRAWQSTNLQRHLDTCERYQDFVALGQPEDELDQRTQDAIAVIMEVLSQQPAALHYDRQSQDLMGQQTQDPAMRGHQQPAPVAAPVPPSERERMMEATLGMVWSALAATGSPEVQPNTALWNLVSTIAPNALKYYSPAAPRHTGLPGQYNTPNHAAPYTPSNGASAGPRMNGVNGALNGPRSDASNPAVG